MSKKVLSIVMTLVLLVATLCVSAGSAAATEAAAEKISGTIYFEIPSDWKNFETVYCHYWTDSSEGPAWQSDDEICTKVSDTIYSITLPEGAWTKAIFSNDNGMQTGDTALSANEIGKVMYLTGNKVENPVNGEMVDEAAWKDYEAEKISGTIYFEIPEAWKNFETVYCHYWTNEGAGPAWQSDDEICTKVNDTLYSITLPEGAWTKAIFSNDNGMQTGDTALTANEIGKVMYYTGNKVENPVNGEMVDEAAWKDYEEPTTSATEDDSTSSAIESKADDKADDDSNNTVLYIVIAAVVVVLIVVIVVVASKKKKD